MSLLGRWMRLALLAVTSLLVLIFFTLYVCPHRSCSPSNFLRKTDSDDITTPARTTDFQTKRRKPRLYIFKTDSIKRVNFTIPDVMVFLHIQKTGGTTFGGHLVLNLNITHPCECRQFVRRKCKCNHPNSTKLWLFSRYSLGWPCGLHSDWTELHACVPAYVEQRNGEDRTQRLQYVTILREPISRVLSEFRCYQRGTTWASSVHKCKGRSPTKKELPPCYEGDTWEDVTIDEFVECKSNLAFNRQARMLADLALVNCYNKTGIGMKKRDKIILKSAIRNLKSMAYFGLMEYQEESQYLFEKTFGLSFIKPFQQKVEDDTRAADVMTDIQSGDLKRIKKLSTTDIRLYNFAKELFFYRVKYFQEEDRKKKMKKLPRKQTKHTIRTPDDRRSDKRHVF